MVDMGDLKKKGKEVVGDVEKKKKEIEQYPGFGIEYTDKFVTDAMKDEMNRVMKDRFGFIV